jgi:AcrR family transcriptional regulator
VSARTEEKTWQQTKSELTRKSIMDAAVDCFYERGYASTTTDQIARRAGVSRGAMLHHFPTRFELISATVRHLSRIRRDMFESAEASVQKDAQYSRVEAGIDAYWEQLNTPVYIVFHELKVAARTDPELKKVLQPVLDDFNADWVRVVTATFPDLALSEAFERTNYLSLYLLEGMANARLTDGPNVPVAMMLNWLKRELRRSYQDVLGKVSRT